MQPQTQQSSKRNTTIGVIVALVIVGDVVMDSVGMMHMQYVPGRLMLLMWPLAVGIAALMLFSEPLMQKIMGSSADAASLDTEPRSIDPSIINRWEMVWDEFGIDPDELRAEITRFPAILAQIELIEATRQGSSNRAVRVALGEQVMTLMRETLGPLAAELAYLKQMNATAKNELTLNQHVRDAAAELLARTPI